MAAESSFDDSEITALELTDTTTSDLDTGTALTEPVGKELNVKAQVMALIKTMRVNPTEKTFLALQDLTSANSSLDTVASIDFPYFHNMRNFVNALGTPDFRDLPVLFEAYKKTLEYFMEYLSLTTLPLTELHLCAICDNFDPIYGQPEKFILANYPEDFVSETKKKKVISSVKKADKTPLASLSPTDLSVKAEKSKKQTNSQDLSLENANSRDKSVNETEKQSEDSSKLSTIPKKRTLQIPRNRHASTIGMTNVTATTFSETSEDTWASKQLINSSLETTQKLVRAAVPTFQSLNLVTQNAVLQGKVKINDNTLRDIYRGRRQKAQKWQPWAFVQQPPDDENRDSEGKAPPCEFSIQELVDTTGDFDSLPSLLPKGLKHLLGSSDFKGKDAMLPEGVRYFRAHTARITAILDLTLKLNPLQNHHLNASIKALETEYTLLSEEQKEHTTQLDEISEIKSLQRCLLYLNGVFVEEMLALVNFFRLEKSRTLEDILSIRKMHLQKLKSRPVKSRDTLRSGDGEIPPSSLLNKNTLKQECWNSAQHLCGKVLEWDKSLKLGKQLTNAFQNKSNKRKQQSDGNNTSKKPYVNHRNNNNRNRNRNNRRRGNRNRNKKEKPVKKEGD
jgi:hypothetical protein